MLSLPSFAQNQPVNAQTPILVPWTLNATASEDSISYGLPVLALDRSDWPSYLSGQETHPRAWRSIQAELSASNSNGWRFGALARAEAWLHASPDAVTAAALDATKSDPDTNRNYNIDAHSQIWQGQGIRAGTPWLKLDEAKKWHYQADVQLLQLQKLRTIDLSGNVTYLGRDRYVFNLQSQRSNPNITSPFLASSGSSGLGSSLSVALQGEPAPGWQLLLRADDLLSRLQWTDLATDTAVLNSQVTSRAPDGSLDYAPLVKGQKALTQITRRIGVHWQAKASWSALQANDQTGAFTIQADRKAGINQYWLGWDNRDTGRIGPHWSLEVEPTRRAGRLGLTWRGWHAVLATDGQGTGSQLKSINLGWRVEF